MLTARAAVELFHLTFLRTLVADLTDKSHVALKGGCNLRFYFGSVRYSEDIDLDVEVIAKPTLAKVERILGGPALALPLRAHDLEVVDVSAPKQTDTTQRWKVGLRAPSREPIRTKIEFSRRAGIKGASFEAVGESVTRKYALPRFLATHYVTERAIDQKIVALADRPQTQARDVFDLALLLARPDAPASSRSAKVATAIENAMSVSFDDFMAQVVAYLEPDHAKPYEAREAWDLLQKDVVERLERMGAR